ncbi:cysteine desulfurase-like protein [Singulisphaera sp. PoT]|uniref:cysteine desulfurase-like protein n=1 Tax=Singulisphaera sp. PoT TaxID=3411797 RepID=UPI003BF5E4AA
MVSTGEHQSSVADVAEIRTHFPALERTWNGHPVAYFDGPGGTQVPRHVVAAVADYLFHHNANAHWAYPTSQETDALLAESRQALADFLNASPTEVVFGNNMTSLSFHIARALGRGYGPKDEIVVTELDHHANVAPWRALERERGVQIRVARMVPETGQLDWDHFDSLLNESTRIVAVGAASNALGTINDVKAAAANAHAAGALIYVDAVHYAAHASVDVRDWDCDFLACSAYKYYGPHVGVVFGKEELLQLLDVPKLLPAPNTPPDRCETGTQNHEGIVGAAAAVNLLASLSPGSNRRARLQSVMTEFHHRGTQQVRRLWEGLSEIPELRLYGPTPDADRTSTISFSIGETPVVEVARHLAVQGIFASHGDFYASTVAERYGRSESGFVRLGCACYTTDEEIARVIDAIRSFPQSS